MYQDLNTYELLIMGITLHGFFLTGLMVLGQLIANHKSTKNILFFGLFLDFVFFEYFWSYVINSVDFHCTRFYNRLKKDDFARKTYEIQYQSIRDSFRPDLWLFSFCQRVVVNSPGVFKSGDTFEYGISILYNFSSGKLDWPDLWSFRRFYHRSSVCLVVQSFDESLRKLE